MASLGRRLKTRKAGPVAEVTGAAPAEGASTGMGVEAEGTPGDRLTPDSDAGMALAHAPCDLDHCGGAGGGDELGEAAAVSPGAAVAPAACELEHALRPVALATEGAASSSSAPGGHQPLADPSAGVASGSGLGQLQRFGPVAASVGPNKQPRRKVWTTPPVVNKVAPPGGAIVLDLNARRWKGSFKSFSCSKSWTLTGFTRRSALDHVLNELWRASGVDRPSTAHVDQTPLEEWCGTLDDGPADNPPKPKRRKI
jgi:hypothetical protein